MILGAGESGVGAALLAKPQGYDVFVSDGKAIKPVFKEELQEAGIEFEEGEHQLNKILAADEIIKSPGIGENNDLMRAIRETAIPVISEIEWAYRFSNGKKIIAITGTNGKTTTTALTGHIFKQAG